jgi:hypothetical protein
MSRRWAGSIGWTAWIVCVGLAGFALVLSVISVGVTPGLPRVGGAASGRDVTTAAVYFVAIAAFATVGAVLVSRRTRHRIGWVFLGLAVVVAVRVAGGEYADYALVIRPGSFPGGRLAVALGEAVSPVMFSLLGLAVLLFPDGALPSRRWRRLPWLLGAASVAGVLGNGLVPGSFTETGSFDQFTNPLGVGSTRAPFEALAGLAWLLVTVGIFACGVAMVSRMRRAQGIVRLQLKWVTFAAANFAVGFIAISITFFAELSGPTIDTARTVLLGLGFCGIPVAAGVAILRYRLYDIDVVINRTLVYGALTGLLASAYLASVLLLQLILSPSSNLSIAASTLAVAALVRPARARIQALVDRRFFRSKYDAQRTLEAFTSRVRDQVSLVALDADLRTVASETMQPAHVSLWLRPR